MAFRDIPYELKNTPQWILWRMEERNEKNTKVPYQPDGDMARSNDKRTWYTFHTVVKVFERGGFDGIGFMFSKDDPYIGIDIDDCVDDGEISSLASYLIDTMNSYAETSPSGTGIHIIVKGELPLENENATGRKNSEEGLEIYRHGRYLTFTGNCIRSGKIAESTDKLQGLFDQYFERTRPAKSQSENVHPAAPDLSNAELWQKMFNSKSGSYIQSLFFGQLINDDHSGTDQALCNHLAFWTNKDHQKMDSMFRESQLMRDKWDEQRGESTYGTITIQRAIDDTGSVVGEYEQQPNYEIRIEGNGSSDPKDKKPFFRRTDLGNAERLVHRHGENIRYNSGFNKWFIWDKKRWAEDQTGKIKLLAKDTVRNIYKEASDQEDADQRQALSKHATTSESRSRIESMISLAQSEVPILPDDLDQNKWLFNCDNGVVDLRTGKLLPHDRRYLINKISPVPYEKDAKCPTWEQFLEDIMQDDQGNVKHELINFLQKAIGYSLTGDTSEQVLFFLYGKGKNGKSTFLDTIKHLFDEYGRQASTESFTVKKNDGARSDLATLKGSRLVAASESEEGARLAESLIKQLTGGEPIQARFLYGNPFEYVPQFKIFFVTNHKPAIRGSDEGIWRRIRLIPFTVTIPEKKRDKNLPEKLMKEMPGILRWAVEGCLKWQSEGLGNPKEIEEATSDYREEMDVIGSFFDEHCVINDNAKCHVKDLYKIYEDWCHETSEYLLSRPKFNRKVEDRGFVKSRDTKGYYFKGLGISLNSSFKSTTDNSSFQRKKL